MPYIKTIKGNLLDFPQHDPSDPDIHLGINVIAHSCNCRMIMGGGIARQIKSRYPQAYEADVKYISNEYDDNGQYIHPLGNFSKAEVISNESKVYLPDGKGLIYNMYTQAGVGTGERQVNYEKFWQALNNVEKDLYRINVEKHEYDGSSPHVLGLHHGISCGLAGGNWEIREAMIKDVFVDSPMQCCIVKVEI